MVYLFLANGFEEVEALCPADLMRRAGIGVTTVSISEDRVVMGARKFPVIADTTFAQCDFSDAEMLFIPGGMPGTTNLGAHAGLCKLLKSQAEAGKPIAAICAAPSVLGGLGILAGKEAICYPGFEDKLIGAKISDKKVVRDGNILTGAGMGVAFAFGLCAIEMLKDRESAEKIRESVIG